jgi:hypothetical protein
MRFRYFRASGALNMLRLEGAYHRVIVFMVIFLPD